MDYSPKNHFWDNLIITVIVILLIAGLIIFNIKFK